MLSYRVYVTDALKIAAANTQQFAGGQAMAERWAEGLKPRDTRSGDEIAADIIRRAGLTQRGGGGDGT